MTTFIDGAEVHPAALVTVKLYVFTVNPDIVAVVPVPVTVPGLIVHVPVAGNPLKSTLPVGRIHVGWTMFPATGADGNTLTVTVTVVLQPVTFVYVITLVPGATGVTKPVLLTVATAVEAEVHGFEAAGVPDPVNWDADPMQTESVPVIVGNALTVTVAVILQPALLV